MHDAGSVRAVALGQIGDPVRADIGRRLKFERLRLGLSRASLADAAGVTVRAQLNYEDARSWPSIFYLVAVDRIGIDVRFVLTGVHSSALSDEETEPLKSFRAASPRLRVALLGIASMPGMSSRDGIGLASDEGENVRGSGRTHL